MQAGKKKKNEHNLTLLNKLKRSKLLNIYKKCFYCEKKYSKHINDLQTKFVAISVKYKTQ